MVTFYFHTFDDLLWFSVRGRKKINFFVDIEFITVLYICYCLKKLNLSKHINNIFQRLSVINLGIG